MLRRITRRSVGSTLTALLVVTLGHLAPPARGDTGCAFTGRIDFSSPLVLNPSSGPRSVTARLTLACGNHDPLRPLNPVNASYVIELAGAVESDASCGDWLAEGTSVDLDAPGSNSTLSGDWYMDAVNGGSVHNFVVDAVQSNDREFSFVSFSTVATPTTQNCLQGATTFQLAGVATLSVSEGPSWDPTPPALLSPPSGYTAGREGMVPFTVRADDLKGAATYHADVTVRNAAGNVVSFAVTGEAPEGVNSTGLTLLPLSAGSYTWTAKVVTPGHSGPESPPRSFTVAPVNTAPGAPVLVVPADGNYSFGEPATFAVRATDPDGDPYRAHITVRHSDGTEYDINTLYTASGTDASGSPATILPAGSYTWWAVAEDIHAATGSQSGTGSFAVSSSMFFPL